MANTLVVFYSRTGITGAAARRIAEALGADLEEIREPSSRAGIRGYLRSGREAFRRQTPPIDPTRFDPTRYELVVLATPIWNMSLASPMRSYLSTHRLGIKQFAAVITCGGMGAQRVLRQMEELVGMRARVTTVLTDEDRKRRVDLARVNDFVEVLRSILGSRRSADFGLRRSSESWS